MFETIQGRKRFHLLSASAASRMLEGFMLAGLTFAGLMGASAEGLPQDANSPAPSLGPAQPLGQEQSAHHAQPYIENLSLLASYKLNWNGISVATTDVSVRLAPEDYSLSLDVRPSGLAGWFADGYTTLKTDGLRTGRQYYTKRYSEDIVWEGERFLTDAGFNSDGTIGSLKLDVTRKNEDDPLPQHEAVPEDMQRGPDPLSLLMELFHRDIPRGETLSFKSFDGTVVLGYDVSCDSEPVVPNGDGPFEGADAYKQLDRCEMDVNLLAGKRIFTEDELAEREQRRKASEARTKRRFARGGSRARQAIKEEEKRRAEEPLVIWVGEHAGVPLPVHMTGNGGSVVIALTHVSSAPLEGRASDANQTSGANQTGEASQASQDGLSR